MAIRVSYRLKLLVCIYKPLYFYADVKNDFFAEPPAADGRAQQELHGVGSEIWAGVSRAMYRIAISRDRWNVATSMWRALLFL